MFVRAATIALASSVWSAVMVFGEPPVAELLKLHTQEAADYRVYRDEGQEHELKFAAKPVFTWTNLVGEHTQQGHLFIWTDGGRPAAIGTIFSARISDPTKRMLVHEFHTLATEQLFPVTPETSAYQWRPSRGIRLEPLDSATKVAATAGQRLLQMRSLARSFEAENRTHDGKTWELRLLPTPLYQYEPERGHVLQGALFAMVSSAGTDPEIILLVEARRQRADEPWAWHGAALRFSDKDLVVKRNGKTVWSSLDDETKRAQIKNDFTLIETADKTYMCYRSRIIDELADETP